VDAPELIAEGVEQQQVEHLPRLSISIPFLDGKVEGAPVYYDTIPTGINWLDGKSIQEAFPLLIGNGKRQVPQSLLMDADTDMDKLVVTNWWRGLTKDEQLAETDLLKRVYRAYSSSNAKLVGDYWESVRNSIESRPAAAACVDDTSNVYVGTADTLELREAGMACTVSARVAQKKKGKRKVSDPATSPSHMFDRTTRIALMQMENSVNNVNTVTDKPEDATFSEGLKCFSVVVRDTGTPQANGKIPRENRRRKKPKMEIYGLREGVMGDISSPLANLLQAFVVEAEKTHDVQMVHHGQEPPTQEFSRNRRRTKTRSFQEIDEEWDAHVASGLIQRGTYSLDDF
jgi:hypothetical protein